MSSAPEPWDESFDGECADLHAAEAALNKRCMAHGRFDEEAQLEFARAMGRIIDKHTKAIGERSDGD